MAEHEVPEPHLPLSFAAARQIDLLCDEFERAWQNGTPPPLEEYLRSADSTLVPVLRAELLQTELECRFRRGERPAVEPYQARFPECAEALPGWLQAAALAVGQRPTPVPSLVTASSTENRVPGPETPSQYASQPPARPIPGVLGEYDLLESLGEGGMGEVYRARHRRLGKLVALKVVRQARLTSPEALARFRREMEAVGQLDHPHLVEAHDAGEQDGIAYLVLKLIDGVDLHRLVQQQGPLPVAEACAYTRQAALGLQYLHERGLVHRDIKPSNLMRTSSGTVKVLDLGLARLRSGSAGDELTGAHVLMGTADFMAPEQADDAATVDIRADLYSLGATLYYLLTGKAPFGHHRELLAKLKAHGVETLGDVRAGRPEVPEDVAVVLARLLAKRPEERFATPQELADALAPFATPGTAPVGEPGMKGPEQGAITPKEVSGPLPPALPGTADSRVGGSRRKILVVAAGLVVLQVVVGAMLPLVKRTLWPTTGPATPGPLSVAEQPHADPTPAPSAPQPLQVLRLDVEHFARVGNFDRPMGLLGRRSFTTHCDDALSLEGQLSAPAYCYLIAYRPNGTEELCFPEKEDEAPPLTDRPRYPSVSAGVLYGLNEGPGLCAFVLVARSKPLPPYAEWRRQGGASPWTRSEAQVGVVWRCDGATLWAHTIADPEARGKGQEVRGVGELPRLVEWLRQGTEAEAVAAVAFAVRPQE